MTNAFTWGFDGWVYACHGFSNDSTVKGTDRQADHDAVGQHLPDEARRLARRVLHARPGQPVRPGVRPAGQPLLVRLPQPADLPAPPRGVVSRASASRTTASASAPRWSTHDHGSTAIAGIAYYAADQFPAEYRDNDLHRQRRHQPDQPRPDRVARLDPEGASSSPTSSRATTPGSGPSTSSSAPTGPSTSPTSTTGSSATTRSRSTHPGRDRERGRIWRIVYRGPDGKAPRPAGARSTGRRSPVDDADRATSATPTWPSGSRRRTSSSTAAARPPSATVRGGDLAVRLDPRARVHALWVLERLGPLDDASLHGLRDGRHRPRASASTRSRVLAERPELDGRRSRACALGGAEGRRRLRPPRPPPRRWAAIPVAGEHPARCSPPPVDARGRHAPDPRRPDGPARPAPSSDGLAEARRRSAWTERDRRRPGRRRPGRALGRVGAVPARPHPAIGEGPTATWSATSTTSPATATPEADAGAGSRSPTGRRGARPSRLALLKAIQQGSQERGAQPAATTLRRAAATLAGTLLALDGRRARSRPGSSWPATSGSSDAAGQLAAIGGRPGRPQPQRRGRIAAIGVDRPGAARSPCSAGCSATPPRRVELREQAASSWRDRRTARGAGGAGRGPADGARAVADRDRRRPGRQPRRGPRPCSTPWPPARRRPGCSRSAASPSGLESAGIPDLDDRIASLLKGLPPADQKLQDADRAPPRAASTPAPHDPRGAPRSSRRTAPPATSSSGKGAKVGPQLDGIGIRGLDRLLEDILDPNRNVDQASASTNLALDRRPGRLGPAAPRGGRGPGPGRRPGQGSPRPQGDRSRSARTAQLSPMPANLAEQIAEPEFYDLMAYLLEHREKTKP